MYDLMTMIMVALTIWPLFALVYCQIRINKECKQYKKDKLANDLYWEERNRRSAEIWGD